MTDDPMTMRERIARLLRRLDTGHEDGDRFWLHAVGRHVYRDRAAAVLAEMREPTPGMVKACINELTGERRVAGAKAWRAMIDAALEGK